MQIEKQDIIIENPLLRLVVGADCIVKSLIHKPSGEECLMTGEEIALFSVTQERPYNNEVKLAHPNKRTTFQSNRIVRNGNKLIIGFEIIPYEAVIIIEEKPMYISFALADFIVHPGDYGHLRMTPPPAVELRLVQLPVRNRENFGEWLNVSWDSKVAVNVLATSPHARIDSQRRKDYRILSADAVKGIKLKGCGAALIVSSPDELLDAIDSLEVDYDLPRGAQSRRSEHMNASAYWTHDLSPANVDTHIAYAKQGGFRMMLLYYTCFCKEKNGYSLCGDYDYNDAYPNGAEDLKRVLDKIKAAGITPGIHFLHTHIGHLSRYVTPVADHRLHLTYHFTLAKPLGLEDTTIYVEENPEGMVTDEKCRVLKFGGELISYESYSTEYPYCFTGCTRGHWDTHITEHDMGIVGGILDITEYGGSSIYLDQNSALQDEIADKIANLYNAGFEFVYFDGSEGTNAPFEYHVPNAQYRVYKKFKKAPLYCEGAAKAHFSWHMLSGGNAFDTFRMNVFKEKIAQFPAEEAPRMRQDFTRVNFGWWAFFPDTQADIYEYGTSRAAAWDCPGTMLADESVDGVMQTHPRLGDVLEVLRRWEDVRAKKWLTEEQKLQLQDLKQEHILLINECGEYELVPYDCITNAASGDKNLSAFSFERAGKSYVVFWHTTGSGTLHIPLRTDQVIVEKELGGEQIAVEPLDGGITVPVSGRIYLSSNLPVSALTEAFTQAKFVE